MTALNEHVTAETGLLEKMLLQYQVEQFYYHEAALLDRHAFADWVELFADDATYFMPVRSTRSARQLDQEFTQRGEIAWFDDTKAILRARAVKLASGTAWAEDPPSRTRHLITNIRVVGTANDDIAVESNFHLYRTRLKSEETSWIGSRKDTLRPAGDSFLIASRLILLEQTVVLSRNLSNFF